MTKQYTVTMRPQHPAWDEKDGIEYLISAASKAEAVKRARAQAYNDGHVGRGRLYFTAEENALKHD